MRQTFDAMADLYVQQFKTTFASMVQYRASLFIWMIGHVLEPLVYLVVWSVVSEGGGGSVADYTTAQFAGYFIMLMLVENVSYTWIMYEYDYRVREGMLSPALLRPVHPIHIDIADNISSKAITLPFMMIVAMLLSLIFHPSIAPQPWALAAALPALVLAFLLRFLLEWTLAQAAFWTTRVSAINQSYFVLVLFLSGQVAPLSLFPRAIQIVANILPFRWMLGFPVELLLGRLTPTQAAIGIGAQAVWVILAYGLMRLVWKAGIRLYSAVGA
jgi:viologen exporter family transport system permease protein